MKTFRNLLILFFTINFYATDLNYKRSFFNKDSENFNIYTKKDKLNFLKDFGIDRYINFAFDKKLSDYSSNEFIDKILVNKLNIKNLIVGSDFKFGKDREGNVDILNSF